jgi:hypothetical protein
MHLKRRTHFLCSLCKMSVPLKRVFVYRQGPMDKRFCGAECAQLWSRYRHHPDLYHLMKMTKQEQQDFLCGITVKELIQFYYV